MARVAARASTPAPAVARSPAKSGRKIEEDVLLTAVLCLVAFGAVMVYSASSASTVVKGGGDGTGLLLKYLMYGAAGFVALRIAARVPLQQVVALTGPLLAVSFGLLVLVKVPGFGITVNGAKRWLGAGPLQFQPSEIAKLALVLYSARFLAERPRRLRRPKDLAPLGLVAGTSVLLVATQPDLGTALVICFTVGSLLIVAGIPMRWIGGFAGAGAVLVSLYAVTEPYRMARLTSFLNPWDHAGGAGFQAVQGQIAIGSGGLFGNGLGQSVQKIFYLPGGPHRLHPRDHRRGGRPRRHLRADRAVRHVRVGRAADRPAGEGPLRRAAGRGRHLARPVPGAAQPLGGPRHRAADGRAAALHLLRVDEPRRPARRLRAARERRSRRLRAPAGHQRGPRCATIQRRWSRRRS